MAFGLESKRHSLKFLIAFDGSSSLDTKNAYSNTDNDSNTLYLSVSHCRICARRHTTCETRRWRYDWSSSHTHSPFLSFPKKILLPFKNLK